VKTVTLRAFTEEEYRKIIKGEPRETAPRRAAA
jgi:hypothetical protein